MEHHVIIEKLCSCAKKEGLDQVVSFETKEGAKNAAEVQLSFMSNNFCGKHSFDITEVNDHFGRNEKNERLKPLENFATMRV